MKSGDYSQAYPLAKEFVKQFPEEMYSHLFLAKSLMGFEKIKEAESEAQSAFSQSKSPEQVAIAGILLACIYYRLEKYQEGKRLIDSLRTEFPERAEIETLRFVFAMTLQDAEGAASRLKTIHEIDAQAAKELADLFLKQ